MLEGRGGGKTRSVSDGRLNASSSLDEGYHMENERDVWPTALDLESGMTSVANSGSARA
jgi:hypothetical protein